MKTFGALFVCNLVFLSIKQFGKIHSNVAELYLIVEPQKYSFLIWDAIRNLPYLKNIV